MTEHTLKTMKLLSAVLLLLVAPTVALKLPSSTTPPTAQFGRRAALAAAAVALSTPRTVMPTKPLCGSLTSRPETHCTTPAVLSPPLGPS